MDIFEYFCTVKNQSFLISNEDICKSQRHPKYEKNNVANMLSVLFRSRQVLACSLGSILTKLKVLDVFVGQMGSNSKVFVLV